MTFARIFWPLVATAILAACSGNLGGGQSTLPGAPQAGTNVQQVAPPPATSTPSSASNVATIGNDPAPQALPNIQGWGGSIAFPNPTPLPSGSPNSKATAAPSAAPTPGGVSIGITAGVVEPADAPHFSSSSAKRRGKSSPGSITPLFFVSLLATSDVTLAAYPKIAFDVPRDIAAKHRNDTFALALYDPEQKEKAYQLAIAERDLSSPLPGSVPSAVASAAPTPVPVPTPFPNGPLTLTPPPLGPAQTAPNGAVLPPERVAFGTAPATLVLRANRPVVFALYAVAPQPSPSPSASAASMPTPSPGASSIGAATSAPSAAASASAASPQASASASPPPTGKPTLSP